MFLKESVMLTKAARDQNKDINIYFLVVGRYRR